MAESKFGFPLSCTRSLGPHLSRGLQKPAALPKVQIHAAETAGPRLVTLTMCIVSTITFQGLW